RRSRRSARTVSGTAMRNGSTCMPPLLCRPRALQQWELIAGAGRMPERRRLGWRQPPIEAELACRDVEERPDLLGVLPLPALAVEEARVADPAAARVADAPEHAVPSFRIVLREPRVEQLVERLREPDKHPAGAL